MFDRMKEYIQRAYKGIVTGTGGGRPMGGLSNAMSGLSGPADKARNTFFKPTHIYWRNPLEILYVQSWAAKKAIDIPVDDAFLKWRVWSDEEDSGSAEKMEDAENKHNVSEALRMTMKQASAYGTGCLLMMSTEAPLTEPLDVERIKPGDLKSLQ